MTKRCAVSRCNGLGINNERRRMFKFPSDERRCRLWIKACQRKDLESKDVKEVSSNYKVCDLHFTLSDMNAKGLRCKAIPTLNLLQSDSPIGTAKCIKTEASTSHEAPDLCGSIVEKRNLLPHDLSPEAKRQKMVEMLIKKECDNDSNVAGSQETNSSQSDDCFAQAQSKQIFIKSEFADDADSQEIIASQPGDPLAQSGSIQVLIKSEFDIDNDIVVFQEADDEYVVYPLVSTPQPQSTQLLNNPAFGTGSDVAVPQEKGNKHVVYPLASTLQPQKTQLLINPAFGTGSDIAVSQRVHPLASTPQAQSTQMLIKPAALDTGSYVTVCQKNITSQRVLPLTSTPQAQSTELLIKPEFGTGSDAAVSQKKITPQRVYPLASTPQVHSTQRLIEPIFDTASSAANSQEKITPQRVYQLASTPQAQSTQMLITGIGSNVAVSQETIASQRVYPLTSTPQSQSTQMSIKPGLVNGCNVTGSHETTALQHFAPLPRPIRVDTESTQTTKILLEHIPLVKQLRQELRAETKKLKMVESQYKCLSKVDAESNIPPLLQKIINAHKKMKNRSWHGNRYDDEYLMFALNVYFASPVAYRILSDTLCLPSVRTLQKRTPFDICTKFDDKIIKCLQTKIRRMSESDKYCIVCAEEMPLKRNLHYQPNKDKIIGFHEIEEKQTKEVADRAFVVMARGLLTDWIQPLAFCFLNRSKTDVDLDSWLFIIFAKMIEVGFKVLGFTSDQDLKFINIANNLFVSADQPDFIVNDHKIYYIFDVPHLLKSLRNNLLNYDFVYNDSEGIERLASWNDIKNLYEIEKNKKYKIAYKLSESHIRPYESDKKCLKYAKQVLSRTVAIGIASLVGNGQLPEKALGTTEFVQLINDTFDILNTSTLDDDYKYKKAFNNANFQIKMLEKVQRVLLTLRVIDRKSGEDVTSSIKFIKGLLISIKSTLNIASELQNAGFSYLFTQRLHRVPLENLFGKEREQDSNSREITANQFYTMFRRLFIDSITKKSETANNSEDLDQILTILDEEQRSFLPQEDVPSEPSLMNLQVATDDYSITPPEKNAFTYICKHLLKKAHKHHKKCEEMKHFVKRKEVAAEFKEYVRKIDTICNEHLTTGNFSRIGNELFAKIVSPPVEFGAPCPCFPLGYLNKLFVRFKIFNLLQHNNEKLNEKNFPGFRVPHLYSSDTSDATNA